MSIFHLYSTALKRSIEQSHSGKIKKVNFKCDSENIEITPDLVIVAAGTFGSPAIVKNILESLNINPKNLGKGLIDHPVGFLGKVKFNKQQSVIMHKFSLKCSILKKIKTRSILLVDL